MGAYEYQGVPWHPMLVGDVDGDGEVAFSDLLAVLAAWGECDADCCLADINFTWAVDFNDENDDELASTMVNLNVKRSKGRRARGMGKH